MGYPSKVSGLKFYKRLDIYKNYKGSNRVDPKTMEAHSYQWWKYLMKVDDLLIFNSYTYSNSTSKHQVHTLNLLRSMGKKPDVYIECHQGLGSWETAIADYEVRIAGLEKLIATPKTRKAKNEERKATIEHFRGKIEIIKALVKNDT